MPKWQCEFREIVCIGFVPTIEENEAEREVGRWFVWDAPWSEDVVQYDCPMRLSYSGKRWCWSFGARSQKYDWKQNRFAHWDADSSWRRFVVYPRDHRKRYDRQHVWTWHVPKAWFVITPEGRKYERRTHD